MEAFAVVTEVGVDPEGRAVALNGIGGTVKTKIAKQVFRDQFLTRY